MFSAKFTLLLLRLLIVKCVSPANNYLFPIFHRKLYQGEDQGPVTAAPYEVSKIIDHAFVDSQSDAEKVQFLEKSWRPPPNSILDKQVINRAGKTVTTKFQTKWLDQRNWLAYSANPLHCGGWCKVCLLFLTTKEKDAALGYLLNQLLRIIASQRKSLIHMNQQTTTREQKNVDCKRKPSCKTLLTVQMFNRPF